MSNSIYNKAIVTYILTYLIDMTCEFGLGWNTKTSSPRVRTTGTQHSVSLSCQSRCFVVSLRTMNTIVVLGLGPWLS